MQAKLCVKCKKNVAVVFITKMENGKALNEGYCLSCARKLGIPQINDMMKQMGITDEDLENLDDLSDNMSAMFGQMQPADGAEEDEVDSQTATFPLLHQLFGGSERHRKKRAARKRRLRLPHPRRPGNTNSWIPIV